MITGSFSKHVGGFTSDHTYQTAKVSSYSKVGEPLVLTGMTWNLLNKAHSKSGEHSHRNNPFDVDEYEQYYILRKGNQLRFLWHQLRKNEIDFIVLQEVDMFTRDPLMGLVKSFLEKIRKKGWYTVHTDKTDDVKVPLLTLYNGNKLHFVNKRAILPSVSGKNTSLEATFDYLGTKSEICITNMHLDFDTDHRESIIEYQRQQIADDKFTILAGDTNHTPERDQISLVGDLDNPTNISIPMDGQESMDDGGMVLQRLDGFMVGPACSDSRVEIIEGTGAYFKWKPSNLFVKTFKKKKNPNAPMGSYVCRVLDPQKERATHVEHISLPGQPWIRDKYKHLLID